MGFMIYLSTGIIKPKVYESDLYVKVKKDNIFKQIIKKLLKNNK